MRLLAPFAALSLSLCNIVTASDASEQRPLSSELTNALQRVPAEQKKGMTFLIEHMPQSDRETLSAEFLLENVHWAYKARETFPWAKTVPEEIFLNDVLPYATLNERRDNWRKDFCQRFSKHVEGKQTMQEAIHAVNAAIKDEIKVDYNTKRKKPHQSPYESMEINMASCTGLSILLCDAFRAVGIPARVAGTPAWTTKQGNHNWVEVWVSPEKGWQFTEYYPDPKGLDHGWLLADAAKANPQSLYHSIYASSWKPADRHFPLVWDLNDKSVHAVNVSERYIQLGTPKDAAVEALCELRIEFLDKNGNRIAVPATLRQMDAVIGKGTTPKSTDDMNRYLTIPVKRGQLYTLSWMPKDDDQPLKKQIKISNDAEWQVETLR